MLQKEKEKRASSEKELKDKKAKVTERKTEKDDLLKKLENEKEKRISSEKDLRDKKIKVVQVKWIWKRVKRRTII